MKNVMTPAEADRLQYLEEKQARRGLTDKEDVEMMELLVSAGVHEHAGLDPVTGEQRYRPTREYHVQGQSRSDRPYTGTGPEPPPPGPDQGAVGGSGGW
jgi:hypothetical protein